MNTGIIDIIEVETAARRHRAHAIAGLIAAGFAWILSHAHRPHLARQG